MRAWGLALIFSIGIHGVFMYLPEPQQAGIFEGGNTIKFTAIRVLQAPETPRPSPIKKSETKSAATLKPKRLQKEQMKLQDKQKPPPQKIAARPPSAARQPKPEPAPNKMLAEQAEEKGRDPEALLTVKSQSEWLSPKRIDVDVEEKPEGIEQAFQDLKGGYQVMPLYPLAARREGREGDVLLKVKVLANGRIGDISVARSSQSPDLDAAAIDAVTQWQFEPARRNGIAVQQITLLPIHFDLRAN